MADQTITPEAYAELEAKFAAADERGKKLEGLSRDLEIRLKKFDGVDLTKLKADSEALALAQREKAVSDPEELKKWRDTESQKIRAEVQARLEELETHNKKLSGQNRELTVVDKAISEIGEMFNPDGHMFIKDFIRKHVDRDEQGSFLIKSEEGEVRHSPAKPAQKLSLGEWANELAGKFPSLAKPTTKRGSMTGAESSKSATMSGVTVDQYKTMSREQQMQIPAGERGKLAAEALKTMPMLGSRKV